MRRVGLGLCLSWLVVLSGCSDHPVVLYRSSVFDANARLRIASFDANDLGPTGNRENCNLAAALFEKQPGVITKFWCEG